MELRNIEVGLIDQPKIAPRWGIGGETLRELADSIAIHGLLQPIAVIPTGERYRLVAGNRRLTAVREFLGWDTIPAIVHEHLPEEGSATAVENLQRVDLDPVEEALMFVTIMHDEEKTQEQVADLIGKSRSYVAKRIMLLDLDDETLRAVVDKEISWTHALELRRVQEPDRRQYFLDLARNHGVNVRILRTWVDEELARPASGTGSVPAWDGEVVTEPVPYQKLACFLCGRDEDQVILSFVPLCQRDKLELERIIQGEAGP